MLIATNGGLKTVLQDNDHFCRDIFSAELNNNFEFPVMLGDSFENLTEATLNIRTGAPFSSSNVLRTVQKPDQLLNWRIEMTTENSLRENAPCLLQVSSVLSQTPLTCFAAFNPVHNVMAACLKSDELSVFRLCSDKRFSEGSQIYKLKLNPCAYVFDDEKFNFVHLSWSPNGEFLLAYVAPLHTFNLTDLGLAEHVLVQGKILAEILFFRFDAEKEIFKQLLFGDENDPLRVDVCMTSHSPWMSATEFLVAAPDERTGVYIIKLDCREGMAPQLRVLRILRDAHRPTKGVQSDVQYVVTAPERCSQEGTPAKKMFWSATRSRQRTFHYVGAYFGLGYDTKLEYVFGCLASCPWLHNHSRIVILSSRKPTQMLADDKEEEEDAENYEGLLERAVGVLEIPGHLLTFVVRNEELWLVYLYLVEASEVSTPAAVCNLVLTTDKGYGKTLLSCNLMESQPTGTKLNLLSHQQGRAVASRTARLGLCKFDFKTMSITTFNR